jgi:putative sigma-54 modulation protein
LRGGFGFPDTSSAEYEAFCHKKELDKMKFTITEKKIKVSDEIKEYAERKIGKIDRFFRGDAEAFITFSSERGRYRAEVTIENNGMFYRVSELTSDMHASIDSACASIERQIRKNKTRLEKRLREGVFEKEPVDNSIIHEDEEKEFDIVRSKRFPIKPMTPEEAILQMNLLEHEFFAFKNQSEDNAFAIVYRRKNGGYGLISDED